ncbi:MULTISPECIES: hypothetical protein [unclassified Caballeronia]|uniref:hypothetical protein n=1 Tax=unclassified Caballeronia TaxID=2646786 RepID=UPI0020284A8E|nr:MULTISPECIES: hypothetical protein [unclassified Caballeronia]MDR5768089.1 hypothetical protein [Caballeronia sp. LZ028]
MAEEAEEGLTPTAPTPTPLIHLYAEGVDTPLLQSAQPFQSVETSLLAHRFEAARRSGAHRAGICVLSAAHAFFSVSASCASRAPVANAIPHLNSRIAYWCQCISLARTTLGSMFPRYALEHLPIHSFADNQPIPIGVMVEGITEEHGAELAGKLNARRPDMPVQLARFFVCPVTKLAEVRELVPMLSDDALDAAFEVVMH